MNPLVVKVGGALLENPQALSELFTVLNQLRKQRNLVLVHGGGIVVEELMAKLGLSSEKKNGLRVTPFEHIDYITGALAGTANKQLMAAAISAGAKVSGLCLADGNLCTCQQISDELGAVGSAIPNDSGIIHALWAANVIPLISSIGISDKGQLLNVNADQAAAAIAKLLNAELVLLSDVEGILDGNKTLIKQLNAEQIEQLIAENVIRDGMTVKVNAALDAANVIRRSVTVAGWKNPQLLLQLADTNIGSLIEPAN